MFLIHKAHTKMLAEQKILSEDEAATILSGVEQVEKMDRETIEYNSEYEDLFFLVESRIGQIVGDELAGKMHIAKSRNDMGEAMYRIVLRDYLKSKIGRAHD